MTAPSPTAEIAEAPAADSITAIAGGITRSATRVTTWKPSAGGRPLARTSAEGRSLQANGAARRSTGGCVSGTAIAR